MHKPGRPLGLSIAIISSAMLFSVLPLVQVLFYLTLTLRFREIEFMEGGGASGVDIIGLSDSALLIQGAVGVSFLVIAFFAWRGRPKIMRFVFMAAVAGLTAVTTIAAIMNIRRERGIEDLFDPLAGIALVEVRLILTLLIALYVLWYINRGPARAFYRGYYLEEPKTE